ncbi:hypothetical protein D3C71_2167100 [compost metagenome]
MGKKSTALPGKISRQITALSDNRLVRFRMEQMQRSRIHVLILFAACRELHRSIVEAEGMQHFFDKIIVETL